MCWARRVMAARKKTSKDKAHAFGGDWTSTKLDILAKYLNAYMTALNDKPTADRTWDVDAVAQRVGG